MRETERAGGPDLDKSRNLGAPSSARSLRLRWDSRSARTALLPVGSDSSSYAIEKLAIIAVVDYSTLINTVEIASELSIMWISVPCLTSTKKRLSGTGLLGVFTVAVPVQSGLTVYVPVAGVQPGPAGVPLITVCSTHVRLPLPSKRVICRLLNCRTTPGAGSKTPWLEDP